MENNFVDVIIKGNVQVEYIYDEIVNESLGVLNKLEGEAFKVKDSYKLEMIRKQKFSLMSLAIPRIIIRDVLP